MDPGTEYMSVGLAAVIWPGQLFVAALLSVPSLALTVTPGVLSPCTRLACSLTTVTGNSTTDMLLAKHYD
jgi:hypothetical protein